MAANNSMLSTKQQKTLHTLLAQIYMAQGKIVSNIQQQTLLMKLESDPANYNQTLRNIWVNLQTISSPKLTKLLLLNNPPNIQAWLRLATIINQSNTHGNQLISLLLQWQSTYPQHPANALLPHNLQQQSIQAQPPQKIALLLPLTGPFSTQGNAIRNGIFAAYYYWKTSITNAPIITVYNTDNANIKDLYNQSIHDGADFVIGPLTKNHINQLIQTNLSVPTLALNTIPSLDAKKTPNLYQFGLSPLDEAIQAAQKAGKDQHSRVIIINPNNSWGQSIANTFKNSWTQNNGQVVAQLNYKNQTSLSYELRHLFGIDQSYIRADALKLITRKKFHFIPRRRNDFDSIFLVATADEARQIKPRLNYYYTGDVPVYAISQIYKGLPNTKRDRDLNGIIFCDIPWVLDKKQHPSYLNIIKNKIKNIWPHSYDQNPKLYALGVDAYNLAYRLNKMNILPDFGVTAATGVVYLGADNHLYRKLPWAQFKYGKPRLTR